MLSRMIEFHNQNSPFSFFEGLYFMLVASFGIPANLLSMVVLCGQRCGMSRSTVTYLVSLAVVDTLFLLLGGLVAVGFGWAFPAEPPPSVSLCGVVGFNEGWTLCSSQWIVAAFTLERYLLFRSCRPRRLRPCCLSWPRPRWRPSRAQGALLLVLLSVLGSQALSLPFCWVYWEWPGGGGARGVADSGPTFILMWRNVSRVTLSSQCRVLPGSHDPAFLWLHALLSGCLPMTLTLFFSLLTSHQFRRSARVLVAPGNAAPFRSTGSRMRRSGRIQATVALVAVLLALPRYIIQGLEAALSQRAKQWAGWKVAVGVATMMQWLGLVIHFLLYCFLSSGFRRETLILLRCLCRGLRKPGVPWGQCCPAQPPQTAPCQIWLVQDGFQEPKTP